MALAGKEGCTSDSRNWRRERGRERGRERERESRRESRRKRGRVRMVVGWWGGGGVGGCGNGVWECVGGLRCYICCVVDGSGGLGSKFYIYLFK